MTSSGLARPDYITSSNEQLLSRIIFVPDKEIEKKYQAKMQIKWPEVTWQSIWTPEFVDKFSSFLGEFYGDHTGIIKEEKFLALAVLIISWTDADDDNVSTQ